MPDRFIRESALTSESLGRLSDFAERLFWRLTTIADDFGRFVANPAVVCGRTMPLVSGATVKKVEGALLELQENDSVRLYSVNEKQYGYFPAWSKYQLTRAQKSKFPDPPASADICLQMSTNDSCSDKVCSRPNTDSNTHSDLTPEEESEGKPEPITPEDLRDGWNEHCSPLGLPKVEMLSATRRQKAAARLREHSNVEFWSTVFARIRGSPFLLGHQKTNGDGKHKNWKANFDWLIDNDTNCVKVFEGRYVSE